MEIKWRATLINGNKIDIIKKIRKGEWDYDLI